MLDVRGAIGQGSTPLTVGIRDLVIAEVGGNVVLMTTTGVTGGLTSYLLNEGQTAGVADSQYFTSGQAAAASPVLDVFDTQQGTVLSYGAQSGQVFGYTVTAQGDFQATVQTQSAGNADLSLAGMAQTVAGRAYVAGNTGGMIYGLQQAGNGQWQQTTQRNMLSDGVSTAVDLAAARAGGSDYLVVLCQGGDAVTSYAASANGALQYTDTLGKGKGLGILDAPTGLEVVQAHGQTWVLVASAAGNGQSGAISVMRLGSDGSLEPTDHVLDSLNTRFAGTHSLAVVEAGDQVFVVAAGADDGLSLFSLMPGGRLTYLESLSANDDAGLASISGLAAHRVGDEIQIFTSSGTTPGLTQLSVSLQGRTETFVAPAGGGQVAGGAGHDVISGSDRADTLAGHGGDDILWDGKGADRLTGGAGDDLFVMAWDGATDRIDDFNAAGDRLDLSHYQMLYDPSQLTVSSTNWGARVEWRGQVLELHSHDGARLSHAQVVAAVETGAYRPALIVDTTVTGTGQDDTLAGGWGSDSLMGYAGDDTLNGGGGDDVLMGGSQADRLMGESGDDTLWGGDGTDFALMGTGNDVFEDNAQAGQFGRDTVYAGAGDDTIRGGGGNDRFFGELDSDMIRGGAGNDTLAGGAGNDRLYGETGADRLFGGTGQDTLAGNGGNDLLRGGGGQDRLEGGLGNDQLFGELGNDRLLGQDGADTLDGGSGADYLAGGAGADRLIGGHGADTVDGGHGADMVFLGTGRDLFEDNAQGGVYGRDTVNGGDGNDTIRGGGGNDLFRGEGGNDSVTGGAGADRLEGGAGADTLVGDAGNDLLSGGNDADRLFGGAGQDTLRAGAGVDTLTGGAGNDLLEGGYGPDTFVFAPGFGKDTVADFDDNKDTLRLDDALWSGTRSAAQVVSDFGRVQGGDVVLDFGANEIRLDGVSSLTGLAQDIEIF